VPPLLAHILTWAILALIWLFFLRVLYAVVSELREQRKIYQGAVEEVIASAGSEPAPLKLRVLEPAASSGQSFEILEDLTIGRSPACDVELPDDEFASAVHARIFFKDGRLYVEDLNSRNGTYVNHRRIAAPTAIKRSDLIRVGSTLFEVYR
jgi:hypothetical protein